MNWKSLCYRFGTRSAIALCSLYIFTGFLNAQQSRITKAIDNQQRVVLTGHLHPKARPEDDQGRVAPSLPMSYVTLELAQSASQHADLQQLLRDQQTPGSANYHVWLTPEQYADRFGVSTDDLNKITSWLQAQGLSIAAVARGRNWIAVNGEAARVESAFQTEIHQYVSNGEELSGTLRARGARRNRRGHSRAKRLPHEGQKQIAQSGHAVHHDAALYR